MDNCNEITGRLCGSGELTTVRWAGGKIISVLPADADNGRPKAGCWLSAGFWDIQINGYGGHDFNLDAWGAPHEVSTDFRPILDLAARAGTALLCPTITTNSERAMCAALSGIADACDSDRAVRSRIPGFHVEGPFISPEDGPRGAHPSEHVRLPDWEEFQRLQEAARGTIRILTLAPELPGALKLIERAVASGVTVALGHTAAEPHQIRKAVAAGASLSTHLGNGAHATLKRHPNYIWEQMAEDRLVASIIADGFHLPESVLKCMVRAKEPERVILVSDAVALGGLPPGLYADGRFEVQPGGKVTLAGTPYLAGAGHLLDTCLANGVRLGGLTLDQACRSVSSIPAQLLGMHTNKGDLRVGCDADLTLFRLPESGPLEIVATICAGEFVYSE